MVRRFSWCTVVALVVLLFVTTEGLRERSTQVDDYKTPNVRDRGALRFNSKSPEEASTSLPFSRSKSPRDKATQSKKFTERRDEGTNHSNTETKFESSKRSNFRTTKTSERNISTAGEITNSSRRSPLGKNIDEIKKGEPTINRRNGKRYSSDSNDGTRPNDDRNVLSNPPVELSRKTFTRTFSTYEVTETLDGNEPSVFTATTESSRSRTGRKIQTTFTSRDFKTQIPTSRRYSNRNSEGADPTTVSLKRSGGRRSTTERIERGTRSGRSKVSNRESNAISRKNQDTVLSESESVRVDIPLTVESTENPSTDVTTPVGAFSQRQSVTEFSRRSDTKESLRVNSRRGSERSKGQGRFNNSDSNSTGRSSRRGSSKFNDNATTETSEQTVSWKKNAISRERSRAAEGKKAAASEPRSRLRNRNFENSVNSASTVSEQEVKRKSSGDRNLGERRSRVPESTARSVEGRGQDQDTRRGRSRRLNATTPVASVDVTSTIAPETSVVTEVLTTSTDAEILTSTDRSTASTTVTSRTLTTTARPSSTTSASEGRNRGRGRGGNQGRAQLKEDFFNHGLGFRGRKPSTEGPTAAGDSKKPGSSKNDSHYGNPGWTLRRRPGYSNNSESPPKTALPSPREQTNEVIPSNEQSTSTEVVSTVESSTRRSFKKPQASTEESTTVSAATTKSSRRGNKSFGLSKASTESEESDNYPPEFKARLSQLKVTNTKTSAPKSTSRSPSEGQQTNLFGRRLRTNSKAIEPDDLDTSAAGNLVFTDQSLIVNPLTLLNATGLRRVKKSSTALFAERSKLKLDLARRLVKPELNIEENDLDATTASSFSKPKPTGKPVPDEATKVAKFTKLDRRASTGSSQEDEKAPKLYRPRKSSEGPSKVTARPSNSKKGRIISERMVTSISVEERVEETTRSYQPTNPTVTVSSEEVPSATTLDTTRIRFSSRGGKKSKEDTSNTRKNSKIPAIESNDTITTFKPKKVYAYQSRNRKTQDQPSDLTSATIAPKKSTTRGAKQSSRQKFAEESKEEIAPKKAKFVESVTKPTFRPRYSKRTKERSSEEKAEYQAISTTKLPAATSRYSKKKAAVKTVDKVRAISTESPATQTKKIEFRPRTATYRRHSDVPTTVIQTTTKVDGAGVAITPRSPQSLASLNTTTPSSPSVSQEPQVNLMIANDTAQQTTGITGSSNGDSGNTNVFNPTRSAFIIGNGTLLEQLRSTVAPLLSSLGNKTPVFSAAYSNVNTANSSPRITPNGSPPRFSARYKGAELFVRKPSNVYQPTVPSITSSSTTPVTPVENSGSAPPIDVSSPGEPRYLTFYQALESVSIRNEQLQGNSSVQRQEQVGGVPQVDSNATVANGINNNPNNDTTSPTVSTTSPQTPDTTTIQDSTMTPRLPEETANSTPMVTTGAPENPSATEQASMSTESSSTTEQASTSTESSSTTEQASTASESSSTTEQASTATESSSNTEQASAATESSSTTEQASTATESSSTTEQASTASESSSTTEQASTATELSSTTEQASTAVESSSTTEQASTASESSSTTEQASTAGDLSSTTEQSTVNSVESTTVMSTSDATSINTSEDPESNTIELSEATSAQPTEASTTEASTTETVSNNLVDVETTTSATVASTFRNRFIDFAQDILSRLQASLNTTTVPPRDISTTIPPVTEISNVILDVGSRKSSLEVLAQLRGTDATTTQRDLETTTLSQVTTGQPNTPTTDEVTTQNGVGSVTTLSPTTETEQSNAVVTTQGTTTQDQINSVTTTPNPTTTTTIITTTQDSQTTTVDNSNNSTSPPLDTEVTTSQVVASTTDTLLTELMSIAKTLLTEQMNETNASMSVQNPNNTVDSSTGAPDTTQAIESSSIPPDVTTETVESTSTTVAMPDLTTLSVDPSQNEVDSVEPTTTGSPSESSSDASPTTLQSNVPDNEVEIAQTNQTTPLGRLAESVESTTLSLTTESGPQTTPSSRMSDSETGSDTTTQSQTITPASDTTVANIELTTNTYDLMSSNPITTTETQTEVATASTDTVAPLTNSSTVTPQPMIDNSTNEPNVTTTVMVPESILSRVNMVTSTPSTSSESNTEQTTLVPTTDLVRNVSSDVNVETNTTTEAATELTSLVAGTADTSTASVPTTTQSLNVNTMDVTEVTTNQPPLTSTAVTATEVTTNMPDETTNVSQTTPNLENEIPTVARFQDTTSATAQGTAGSGIGQTTENTLTITTPSSSSSPPSSVITTPSASVETTTSMTATPTTETTTSTEPPRTTTTMSARTDVFTVTPMSETTVTTADINENLVQTEAPGTTTVTPDSIMARITAEGMTNGTMDGAPGNATAMNDTQTSTPQTTPGMPMTTTTRPPSPPTAPYIGRFGGSRLTPAPRFSVSSTTRAPLRDYLIYGIYPNKTIVRKRPEDNLIDARNVDSPYVIFGIFPDGKLVRKFPNGTIIPDPPRNPVEVVFSLSTTTTTNRPPPRVYCNQANQGTYNQYQGPGCNNNRIPEPMRNVPSPGVIDVRFSGDAIVEPNGGGPGFTGPLGTPVPSTNEMSNTPLNTQMGTTSNAMSASGGRLTPIVSTGRPPTDSQGGRIVQDRERDEATRTKEAGGQRSSVYIGQDKFVNYWTDGAGNTNPRVVSVNINSVAGGVNEGPSSSIVSFDNLLNSGQNGPVTAPPGFPWRDPLDQIFGITTSSPVITASVASNTLDDLADSNGPASPVNPFVEIFTPFSSTMNRANQMSSTQAPASPPTTAMSPQTTTTTTSAPMTTTTTTTMAPTTTTTTTMAPTTTTTTTTTSTTTTTTTTTPAPTTTMQPSTSPPATTASPVTPNQNLASNLLNLQNNLSPNVQQQNAFGTTFDDLAFLNSLLQDKSKDTSPKTLTQVEQLLANKILSLALNGQGPSPTRAPKAINVQNASPNLILPSTRSPSEPIIIDLLPSSTAGPPTWRPVPTPQQQILNEAPINGNSLPGQATKKQISTTTAKSNKLSSTTARTSLISTTKGPVSNTAKPPTIPRPKTTTQAPLGLGASLWQALFGGGLFGPSTTARPVKPKPVKTTPKSINITPKPIPTTQKPETTQVTPSTTTFRTVDISKIGVGTPNSIVKEAKSVTTPRSISTAKSSLANNPKPKVSKTEASTFSPEDDAKFLVALLRAVQDENKAVPGKKSSGTKEDDESFLRAILSGRALTTTTPAPLNEINNAALLAALLKAQGIEPPTPANNIREQLLLASIGQSVTSAPAASPTTASTTITTVPTSAATRPTDKTVTPGPTSRPRIRTTTWTPSSTYPPPLFSSFSNYGTPVQSAGGDNSGSGALFGATRAFSQFLGAAISGAAQQLQSLVRNGTKIVSDVVG
ncbi:uncharacterized protein LOC116428515 [Nomia melanderi]|uniref:uncharacterized protein LOC116428515 n=1 Tax=Nomia melanderi TaxID=2448451 RepID=UPI003FCD5B66